MVLHKKLIPFSFIVLFIFMMCVPVKAAVNELDGIVIFVELDDDGTAYIEEHWTLYFPDGTEAYINLENLLGTELKDFRVSTSTGGEFRDITPWDINKSRAEKIYKSGLVKKASGYELCWGVGDGDTIGKQTYIINYTLENFVKKYTDGSTGFNWEFITRDISPSPDYVRVTISRHGGFSSEDTNIWAFGFNGEINIVGDKIISESSEPFYNTNYVTVLVQTPGYYFNSASSYDKSFDEVKEYATIGSNYYEDPPDVTLVLLAIPFAILMILFSFFPIILIILFIVCIPKLYRVGNIPDFKKDEINYYRELPFENDLQLGFYADYLSNFTLKYENILSAYLLKWVQAGYLSIVKIEVQGKESVGLKLLNKHIVFNNSLFEEELFMVLKRAVGEDDILVVDKFNKWAKENSGYIGGVLKNIEKDAEKSFTCKKYKVKESGLFGKTSLTAEGRIEVEKLLGFKKYLLDFSLLTERDVSEVRLWGDYLIWATLLGIADKVEEQLKIVNPIYFSSNNGLTSTEIGEISRSFGLSCANGYNSGSSGGGDSSSIGGSGGGGGGGGSR